KLLTALKQLQKGTEMPKSDSAEAEQMSQWLKEIIASLNKKEAVVHVENHSLDPILLTVNQLQHLLVSPVDGKEGRSRRDVEMGKLTDQLVATIKRLLGKVQLSNGKLQGFAETQFGRGQTNQLQPGVSSEIHERIGQARVMTAAKRGSSQQQQSQIHLGPTAGQLSGLTSDSKEMAASTFRRSAMSMDKAGVPGQVQTFDSGPMHRLQQFVLHVRQNGGTSGQQQFVRDFQQILAQSKLTMFGGKQQLTLKLHPQHLGKLNIQLIHENGQLTARLVASTTAAKNLVEAHLPQLQGAFANQNLNVQKLQVLLPYAQPSTQQGYEQDSGYNEARDQHQEADSQSEEGDENTDTSFFEWLEHLHLNEIPGVKL
ncbi:MAG TPA: flagellar hook-length control protein FliK, partial [Bacillales bacterium]|nr:flagellar hook-length control protein FliK [Bacillales bacterium]